MNFAFVGSFIRINNVSEFTTFANNVNSGTSYLGTTVLLENDIDFSGHTGSGGGGSSSSSGIGPIGTGSTASFSGVFDGRATPSATSPSPPQPLHTWDYSGTLGAPPFGTSSWTPPALWHAHVRRKTPTRAGLSGTARQQTRLPALSKTSRAPQVSPLQERQ